MQYLEQEWKQIFAAVVFCPIIVLQVKIFKTFFDAKCNHMLLQDTLIC